MEIVLGKFMVNKIAYFSVEIYEHSENIYKRIDEIQKKFQSMLVNAISHERLSPLNIIIPKTEQLISDIKTQILLGFNDINDIQLVDFSKSQEINKKNYEKIP